MYTLVNTLLHTQTQDTDTETDTDTVTVTDTDTDTDTEHDRMLYHMITFVNICSTPEAPDEMRIGSTCHYSTSIIIHHRVDHVPTVLDDRVYNEIPFLSRKHLPDDYQFVQ